MTFFPTIRMVYEVRRQCRVNGIIEYTVISRHKSRELANKKIHNLLKLSADIFYVYTYEKAG